MDNADFGLFIIGKLNAARTSKTFQVYIDCRQLTLTVPKSNKFLSDSCQLSADSAVLYNLTDLPALLVSCWLGEFVFLPFWLDCIFIIFSE